MERISVITHKDIKIIYYDAKGLTEDEHCEQMVKLADFGNKNKMQVAQGRNQPSVDLLRIGVGFDKGALPGPDMPDWNFIVESRQRPDKSGGALALHQHQIRSVQLQQRLGTRQCQIGNIRQGFSIPFKIQIVIGGDLKQVIQIVEVLLVLRRGDDDAFDVFSRLELIQYRIELDQFFAFPEDG